MGDQPIARLSSRGLAHGIAAYSLWGLFPLYWKMLAHVPALQVLAHRIVWSCIILVLLVAWRRRRGTPWSSLSPRVVGAYAVAAVLIGVNWFLYVWGVSAGLILQTSLGYFINPLVSVIFGVILFHERLRSLQWAAVGVAALGMAYLALSVDGIPWVSVGLATSFASYGVVKKYASLSALEGLTLETVILWVPAAVFLCLVGWRGTGVFLQDARLTDVLLVVGGLVTIVPLLLFASSIRLVPLSTVGILQYIAPSIQFLLGVLVYHEPFGRAELVGFSAVWIALVGFTIDGLWATRAARRLERSVQTSPVSPTVHSNLRIRPAEKYDADAVEHLLRDAARWVDALGAVMWEDGELEQAAIDHDVAQGLYMVAEIDGAVAGAIRFQLEDPLFWPDLPAGQSAFVHRLVVARAWKGQGISQALLEWAAARTRELGRDALRLDCDASRIKLRQLYESCGFTLHSFRHVGPYYVSRYELRVGPSALSIGP